MSADGPAFSLRSRASSVVSTGTALSVGTLASGLVLGSNNASTSTLAGPSVRSEASTSDDSASTVSASSAAQSLAASGSYLPSDRAEWTRNFPADLQPSSEAVRLQRRRSAPSITSLDPPAPPYSEATASDAGPRQGLSFNDAAEEDAATDDPSTPVLRPAGVVAEAVPREWLASSSTPGSSLGRLSSVANSSFTSSAHAGRSNGVSTASSPVPAFPKRRSRTLGSANLVQSVQGNDAFVTASQRIVGQAPPINPLTRPRAGSNARHTPIVIPSGALRDSNSGSEANEPSPSSSRSNPWTLPPPPPPPPQAANDILADHYTRVVAALDELFRAKVTSLEEAHAHALATVRHDVDAAYRAELRAARESAASETMRLVRDETASLEKAMRAGHAQTTRQLKDTHEYKMQMLRQSHREEVQALRAAHQEGHDRDRRARELAITRAADEAARKARKAVEDSWQERWLERMHQVKDAVQGINADVELRALAWREAVQSKFDEAELDEIEAQVDSRVRSESSSQTSPSGNSVISRLRVEIAGGSSSAGGLPALSSTGSSSAQPPSSGSRRLGWAQHVRIGSRSTRDGS